MKHSLLILVLVGLSFALGGCGNKSTRSDESPAETTVAPDPGVAPHLTEATQWLAPDTLALGGFSLKPVRSLLASGMPPDEREERFDAMRADLGRLFQAKIGIDWTKVDAVAAGYGPSWWTFILFGDFSLDGIKPKPLTIEGQEVLAFEVNSQVTGFAVPLSGERPGYAVFEGEEAVTAALKARRESGDQFEILAERSDAKLTDLVAALPTSNLMISAVVDGELASEVPPQVQGMMPEQIAVSLGASTAVLLRGEPERIDALHDFVQAMIEQARAPIDQQYEARGGLDIAEATGAVLAFHYIEAYLGALQVERSEGALAYRMTVPSDSPLTFALPGVLAAVGIPSFQRYIDRSRAARDANEIPQGVEVAAIEPQADPKEANYFIGRATNMAIQHYQRTKAETGTGTFPGKPGYRFQTHPEIPVGGEVQRPESVGGPDAGEVLSDVGLNYSENLSFQFTYEVVGTGADARAVFTAVADFKPGGEMHTERAEVSIDPETGEPVATKTSVTAYGE